MSGCGNAHENARYVAAIGNSTCAATWSGIPYYFLQAGRRDGFLADGLNLEVRGLRRKRSAWQIARLIRAERVRGYQYSRAFAAELGRIAVRECERLGSREVVSHWQLLPGREYLRGLGVRTSFFIDTTLHGLFETHLMREWLNGSVAREAVEREKAEYHDAWRVVTMAEWVRASLDAVYGLNGSRVHTVLPGANLPEELVRERLARRGVRAVREKFTRDRPLRLGFTGKDWKRKGLPRLVRVAETLQRMNIPAEVLVIGFMPACYARHPLVRNAGFVDKARDPLRFIELLESCDFGCSPSHEEPMGIAPLEYLRLGIPVVCTMTGGLVDVCTAAGLAALAVPKEVSGEQLAERIAETVSDPSRLNQVKQCAWAGKEHFRWERAVEDLRKVWAT
jgi:glycosyltransferase involved in cell wall biosynthesis